MTDNKPTVNLVFVPAVLRDWARRLSVDCRVKLLSNGNVWYTVPHLHSGQRYGPFGVILHKSPIHRRQNRWLHFRMTGSLVTSLHRGHLVGVSSDAPILFWFLLSFCFQKKTKKPFCFRDDRWRGAGLKHLNPASCACLKGTVHNLFHCENWRSKAKFLN